MASDPIIFDCNTNGENPPSTEFNAVKIKLDGSLKSELKWDAEKQIAQQLIDQGFKIFWEIDLGLFSRLPLPLQDETQSKSLRLALEVFYQELWEPFKRSSLGLCVYRGSADFTKDFHWYEGLQDWLNDAFSRDIQQFTKETGIKKASFAEVDENVLRQNRVGAYLLNLFCCQSCANYLDFICQDLPDSLTLFIMIDADGVEDPGFLARIISRERFEHFSLIIRGGSLPIQGLAWDDERASEGYISRRAIPLKGKELANIAVCLPPIANVSQNGRLSEALKELNQLELHYRIIPEPFLTMEWDQLDYLLFIPEGMSDLCERKLQGFAAAGGTAVTLGDKIGLPGEETFEEWTEKLLETL